MVIQLSSVQPCWLDDCRQGQAVEELDLAAHSTSFMNISKPGPNTATAPTQWTVPSQEEIRLYQDAVNPPTEAVAPINQPQPSPIPPNIVIYECSSPLPSGVLRKHVRELKNSKSSLLGIHEFYTPERIEAVKSLATVVGNLLSGLPVRSAFVAITSVLEEFPFRLVNPRRESDDAEETSFITLSYCWRSTSVQSDSAEQNPLPVSPSMWQCALTMLSGPHEGLWVDQLCIEQDRVEEVTRVVAHMDLIYARARAVVVILEDVVLSPDEVAGIQLFNDLWQESDMWLGGQEMMSQKFLPDDFPRHKIGSALKKIAASAWYTRGWCLHEAKLARKMVFLLHLDSGPSPSILQLTGRQLAYLSFINDENGLIYITSALVPLEKVGDWIVGVEDVKEIQYVSGSLRRVLPYRPLIEEIFITKTSGNPTILDSDKRFVDALLDKTSILLNTVRNGLVLRKAAFSDLSAIDAEVKLKQYLMLIALADKDPSCLFGTGEHLYLQGPQHRPSWLCQPGYHTTLRDADVAPMNDHEWGKLRVDPSPACDYITLSLLVVAKAGGYINATDVSVRASLEKASKFFDFCVQNRWLGRLLGSFYHPDESLDAVDEIRELSIQMLTCMLECRESWCSTGFGQDPRTEELKPLARNTTALLNLFFARNDIPDESDEQHWMATAQGCPASLLWDQIFRVMHKSIGFRTELLRKWRPVIKGFSTLDHDIKSIVMIPKLDDFILAMPALLINEEHILQCRMWITKIVVLEDGTSGYFEMVTKSSPYGNVDFGHLLKGVVPLFVRVYGPQEDTFHRP